MIICVYSNEQKGDCVSKSGINETQISLLLFYETQNKQFALHMLNADDDDDDDDDDETISGI